MNKCQVKNCNKKACNISKGFCLNHYRTLMMVVDNNSSRDDWETPQKLFGELNLQYNFGFDCCANKRNYKAPYSNDFVSENCLDQCISWMNPPFSKAKQMFEHFFSVVDCGVAIYRCDNLETRIWQDIILPNADWVFFLRGRVCYEGMNGHGPRFPSALIGVGVEPPEFVDGVCCKLIIK